MCVMALYNTISLPVIGSIPYAIASYAEIKVACKRLGKFFRLEEKNTARTNIGDKGTIEIKKFSAKWNSECQKESLKDVTLTAKPGELVVVVGAVGSGKTCLLHALLGEIEKTGGECLTSGTKSYHPQEAWCFGGSIRENILLGAEFDEVRYSQVIKVCGLRRDMELFPQVVAN